MRCSAGPGRGASLVCDISDYQSSFDARRYRREGHVAIMLKAAEGLSDAGASTYAQRAQAAHAEGLRVLHYHYLSGEGGKAQGAFLEERTRPYWQPGDRLVADVEVDAAAGALGSWAAILHRLGHTGLLGYTYRAFGPVPELRRTPLAGWIVADYDGRQRVSVLDRLAFRGAAVLGKQFTDGVNGARPHVAAGISGPVDCTRYTRKGLALLLA